MRARTNAGPADALGGLIAENISRLNLVELLAHKHLEPNMVGVFLCTSSTRPSSPVVGMTIYESDTGRTLSYTSAAVGWSLPWGMPWGFIGESEKNADQLGIGTTVTDVTDLSVTFTSPGNRRYRIHAHVAYDQSTAAGRSTIHLANGANVDLAQSRNNLALGDRITIDPYFIDAPGSGSVTYKVRASAAPASTVDIVTLTGGLRISVEDIGPTGNPP